MRQQIKKKLKKKLTSYNDTWCGLIASLSAGSNRVCTIAWQRCNLKLKLSCRNSLLFEKCRQLGHAWKKKVEANLLLNCVQHLDESLQHSHFNSVLTHYCQPCTPGTFTIIFMLMLIFGIYNLMGVVSSSGGGSGLWANRNGSDTGRNKAPFTHARNSKMLFENVLWQFAYWGP